MHGHVKVKLAYILLNFVLIVYPQLPIDIYYHNSSYFYISDNVLFVITKRLLV